MTTIQAIAIALAAVLLILLLINGFGQLLLLAIVAAIAFTAGTAFPHFASWIWDRVRKHFDFDPLP